MYVYEFDLMRKTGKNLSVHRGNEVLTSNDRPHHMVRSALTSHLRQKAVEVLMSQEHRFSLEEPHYTKERPCRVIVEVKKPTRRKSDAPNVYPTVKALLDGMTDMGLWDDDNDDVIRDFRFVPKGLNTEKCYHLTIRIEDFIEEGD